MIATRHQNTSTNLNAQTLIGLMNDPNCVEVRLFASPWKATADFSQRDGTDNNLPLVAALATYKIPGVADVHVVFDGLFLTAARRPRFGEVQDVMNAAQACGKATYCATEVPFTSALSPEKAVELLTQQGPVQAFSVATRQNYFKLLSHFSEANYPK